jgi:hypothetical protein
VNNKDMKKLIKRARKLAKPFRVTDDRFRLKDIDPGDTLDLTSEDIWQERFQDIRGLEGYEAIKYERRSL